MDWAKQRKRIRRFLRDSSGNIWSDAFLLRLYNNAQHDLNNIVNILEDVAAISIPPRYQFSYLYDWEWTHSEHAQGYVHKALRYYDQAYYVLCNTWELEHIARSTATTGENGYHYIYPWEAWMPGSIAEPPALWFPEKFHKIKFLAHDKDPIEPITKKQLQQDDRTWKTRGGEPQHYWRDETLENHIVVYPIPESITWTDEVGSGVVLFKEGDTVSAETGVIADASETIVSSDTGADIDIVSQDNNLLAVFTKIPRDLEDETSKSEFQIYLRKYIEYFVLEKAFQTNTDGRSPSLAQYWGFRKDMGINVIKRFLMKRKQDRDYQLQTKGAPEMRTRRRPKLPDAYPAQW